MDVPKCRCELWLPRRLCAVSDSTRCEVFIGSSSEGRLVAGALQTELLAHCEVTVWDQDVFESGGYALDSLIRKAQRSDFAVLVATPDDMRESRGETAAVPRDNVILEFGLFAGVLGRDRSLVLATDGVQLPTDTLGLTRLPYYTQNNLRAAVSAAAREVLARIDDMGRRGRNAVSATPGYGALVDEMAMLAENASSQGWRFRDTRTTVRLTSPKGKVFTLSKRTPTATRDDLRPFVATLRSAGLRVNHALRNAASDSPLG